MAGLQRFRSQKTFASLYRAWSHPSQSPHHAPPGVHFASAAYQTGTQGKKKWRKTWLAVAFATAAGAAAGSLYYTEYLEREYGWQYQGGMLGSFFNVGHGLLRSARAVKTVALNSLDYKVSLHDLEAGSEEYRRTRSQVHKRAAQRLLELCEKNRGIYVKAGQFVASMNGMPKEFIDTLSVLQDRARPRPFASIKKVIVEELGQNPSDIFEDFNEDAIAAASLAQVHKATLRLSGREVAVKVQYPGLQLQFELDINTMATLSKAVAWLFPDYQFEWLVPEFRRNLTQELDFSNEGRNAERTATNFARKRDLKVPNIEWELSTSRVLTMEFVHGCKIDDKAGIEDQGLDPRQVASLLVEVFAEMIFCHGWVHGDPHPGNILVRPLKGHPSTPQLVLLDHGLYRQLAESFRLDFCNLWKSIILLDMEGLRRYGERLGAGAYYKYFPIIFTGRTQTSRSKLGSGLSEEERAQLRAEVRAYTLGDISTFMENLNRDFLIVLRTDGLVRSIAQKLGGDLRKRLMTNAKYAVWGLTLKQAGDPEKEAGVLDKARAGLSYLNVRLRIEAWEWWYLASSRVTRVVNWLHTFFVSLFGKRASTKGTLAAT